MWNYGKAGYDRTHNFVFNWVWDVPKASRFSNTKPVKLVFDNWQVSGIASFISGAPTGVGFSTVDGTDLTGGGDGQRIIVTGKAPLSGGERTFDRFFNTTVFARPPAGSYGNAPKDVFRGPGINNWDISIFKSFPIREKMSTQFRWELYNAFNHTQYSGVNTTARFDINGNQVNTALGSLTSAREPRRMQLSLRFSF
jgi:hypothetical protein